MTLKDDTNLMSNRVAVVTGGSKGIGLAVSTALVAREVRVVIGDVLTEQGQEAVNDLNQT
jgi:15-hydroxyprostaglandin dehydrogenase (NAD)